MNGDKRSTTPAQRFKQTLSELFSFLTELIEDINKNGLCDMTPEAVKLVSLLVSAYRSEILLDSFILHHRHWDHIIKRNTGYIMEDFDEMLRDNNITADTSVIKIPFSVHESLTSGSTGTSSKMRNAPVTEQDLEDIWSYFDSLIGIACNHVYQSLNSRDAPRYYREIDIQNYARELNFRLGSN